MHHAIWQDSSIQDRIALLLTLPHMARAFDAIDAGSPQFLTDLVDICEIEAPPFDERARAEFVQSRFRALGFDDAHLDGAGNVVAVRPGASTEPYVVLSAHLDTVFPRGTDCRVRREGARMLAPGIADDSVGVAALLAAARALDAADIATEGTIVFLATVGEEGEGDLRGVRHYFRDPSHVARVSAFLSIDGPGVHRVTNKALGSRRYSVVFRGPGGHSWGDFGIVNPVHALGRAVARLASYPAPIDPRTTFNVGRIEGGASVNTIAEDATMRVDLRSLSAQELDRLEAFFKRAVDEAVTEENRLHASSGTRLDARLELIGARPSGHTPENSDLVQTVFEASRAFGIAPRLDCSSTDSNVPISLGIPSVTIGCGGTAANTHTLAEWYDPTGHEAGIKRLLLILTALSGLQNLG